MKTRLPFTVRFPPSVKFAVEVAENVRLSQATFELIAGTKPAGITASTPATGTPLSQVPAVAQSPPFTIQVEVKAKLLETKKIVKQDTKRTITRFLKRVIRFSMFLQFKVVKQISK